MKKSVKWIIFAIICVIAFVGIYFLYDYLKDHYQPEQLAEGESSTQQNQDHKAPDFTVLNSEGKEVKLSDYFGKPIVLNFWASWCYYCKVEMPDFEKAHQKYSDVQFLMINVTDGHQETMSGASQFIKDEGYSFPVFYDTKLEAATAYGAGSLPMTFFIDENGDLITYASGMLNAENLEKGIMLIK